MKIKRLCAANIREAMRKVRDELGPNAVILSNQRVDAGVEIVAAVDYDEKLLHKMQGDSEPAEGAVKEPPARAAEAAPAIAYASGSRQDVESHNAAASVKPRIVWSQDPMLVNMQDELRAVRHLLEQQMSGLAWSKTVRRQPRRADLLRRLMDFGLPTDMCIRLADQVADEAEPERAWNRAMEVLAQGIAHADDEILTHGGIVALVGPTGVGKTTTAAKLAARFTLRHGPKRVALITTDGYRIGAFDQLRTFGMILDIPVRLAGNHDELRAAVADFSDRPLILIDTAGMSQRDLRLSQQLALFDGEPKVQRYLVLAANAQSAALEEAAGAFSKAPLAGCILTKLDEATRLGGALSVIHDLGLPLAYLGNGQRVPEDLQAVQDGAVAKLSLQFAPSVAADVPQEMLALTFGRKMANAFV